MIEFHRHFERFAASLVRCLSEASYARKASGSATGQNAVNGIRFSDPIDIYIFIYTPKTRDFKIKIFKDRGYAESRLQDSKKVSDKQKVVMKHHYKPETI